MVMMDTMNIRRDLPWLLAVLAPTCTSLLSCSSTQEAPPAQAEAVHSHPTETKVERTLSEADARKNFDVAWRSMSEAGALSDMTDEDWEELRVEYEPQATAARNNKELRAVLDAMIQRLGKSHFSIIAQDAVEMPSPRPVAQAPWVSRPGSSRTRRSSPRSNRTLRPMKPAFAPAGWCSPWTASTWNRSRSGSGTSKALR
jgi:hypothetical protein